MPDEYEVTEILDWSISDTPAWCVSMRKPDGEMHHHIMPKHTVTARAMEYDLDPEADFDSVLDIVLHEPFIDEHDDDDPAVAAGYVTTNAHDDVVAATLWTAETIQDAREAQQLRVTKAKKNRVAVKMADTHKKKLHDHVKQDRRAVREKRRAERPELANLKQIVREERRRVRGRGDGNPLKARIVKKEAAE